MDAIKKNPPKILYVDNNPDFLVSHRLPVMLAAQKAGYEVHAAAPLKPSARRLEALGMTFHALDLDRKSVNPFSEFGTVLALYRLYRELKPDIVHHVSVKPVAYGGVAARIAGVPAVVNALTGLGYVFAAEGKKAEILRMVVRSFFKIAFKHRCSVVILQNPDDLKDFLDWKLISDGAAVVIKGSGVDMSAYQQTPELPGVPVVLMASRLLWDKGVGEFVSAAKLLKSSGKNARFVLAGKLDPGNPSAITEGDIKTWVEAGIIEYWGCRDDMPTVFAETHIVCLPSYYREGVPKVLIEAAACGRPIVTTDARGCREVVVEGVNGFLVPVRDAKQLAEALAKLIDDKDLRGVFGKAGRSKVELDFSIEAVTGATLDLYRKLIF